MTALPRFSTTPPSSIAGSEASEIAVTRVANRGAARGRVLVNDLGAERCVNGAGDAEPLRGEEHRQLGIRQGRIPEGARQRFSHAPFILHPRDESLIHSAARFLRHSERPVDQSAGDILRRCTKARDLIIVDGG